MKITSVKIKGYKNIINETSFDFSTASNYVALIGLNGTGKSNVIEAISLIFSSLYYEKPSPFEYEINYILNGANIFVKNGVLEAYGTTIPKKDHSLYLPSNVIASYSGEELRMWEEIYLESYSNFFQDIKKQSGFVPDLLYINKYSWSIGLIALLCSENVTITKFVKENLLIPDDVILKFEIKKENYPLYEENAALSLIKRLVELQNASADGTIHINEIKTLDIGQKDNDEFVQKLFYYLFVTGMPVKGDKIKADKIIRKIDISFNSTDLKKLSEGEKKLILLYTITQLLANDRSLILLDEPDAHLHIERKNDIVELINISNCFTIFSTHSPKILHQINDENVYIIRNLSQNSLEVIKIDKIKALAEITNNNYTIIDATLALSSNKDILLVEGTNDYNYLIKAIKHLSPDYDNYNFHIINCGGADNVPAVFEQSLKTVLREKQLCLCTFDYDEQGRKNYTKIKEISTTENLKNLIPMFHTKLDGTEHKNNEDFYMEDYFPVDTYKNVIVSAISSKNSFKQLEQYQKPKSIIEKSYASFTKDKYLNFKIILDETIRIQNEFHK